MSDRRLATRGPRSATGRKGVGGRCLESRLEFVYVFVLNALWRFLNRLVSRLAAFAQGLASAARAVHKAGGLASAASALRKVGGQAFSSPFRHPRHPACPELAKWEDVVRPTRLLRPGRFSEKDLS